MERGRERFRDTESEKVVGEMVERERERYIHINIKRDGQIDTQREVGRDK